MIYVPVAVQIVGLLLLLAAVIISWRFRRQAGLGRLPGLLLVALICVGVATAFMVAVLLQEKTGVKLGVSGGIASDARAWMRQHELTPPKRDDVGQNMKVLSDGVGFLQGHLAELPPAAKTTLADLSRMPAKPSRLLSPSEEAQYFQAANTAFTTIRDLSGAASAAK